jgi:hypothetical protein
MPVGIDLPQWSRANGAFLSVKEERPLFRLDNLKEIQQANVSSFSSQSAQNNVSSAVFKKTASLRHVNSQL